MNVFWREIRAYRKSAVIWAIALSVLVVAFMTIYTSFTQDVETSRKILSNLPPAVTRALDIEMSNFFTIFGFFSYILTFVGLAGAVQAMNYGVGVLSKEESGKTADFLLTKPISRTKVYISKLIRVHRFDFIYKFSVQCCRHWTTAEIVSPDRFDSGTTFLLVSGILLLIQLFFVGIGMLLSQLVSQNKIVNDFCFADGICVFLYRYNRRNYRRQELLLSDAVQVLRYRLHYCKQYV